MSRLEVSLHGDAGTQSPHFLPSQQQKAYYDKPSYNREIARRK